jgi:hypothetical protein
MPLHAPYQLEKHSKSNESVGALNDQFKTCFIGKIKEEHTIRDKND